VEKTCLETLSERLQIRYPEIQQRVIDNGIKKIREILDGKQEYGKKFDIEIEIPGSESATLI